MAAVITTAMSVQSEEVLLPLAPNLIECLKTFTMKSAFPDATAEVVTLFDNFPRKLIFDLRRRINYVQPFKNEIQCYIPSFVDMREFSSKFVNHFKAFFK